MYQLSFNIEVTTYALGSRHWDFKRAEAQMARLPLTAMDAVNFDALAAALAQSSAEQYLGMIAQPVVDLSLRIYVKGEDWANTGAATAELSAIPFKALSACNLKKLADALRSTAAAEHQAKAAAAAEEAETEEE